MTHINQKQSEDFWAEVIHRSRSQLCDMNIGSFHQWRTTVGDKEIHRLLNLMELLLSSDNHKFEIEFIINWINYRINGPLLFKSFRASGNTIIKQGMKGEIYCVPVLYVIIRSLIDEPKLSFSSGHEKKWGIDISKLSEKKLFIKNKKDYRDFVT
ncbi:hypothetical protein EQV76_18135 [Salmonella enterica]|nr:hypothetical protein [Salmonella enterica]